MSRVYPEDISPQIDTILRALQEKIQDQGFTQKEVQEALGWGRTYISQLVRGQKSLRIEQIILILRVIKVRPADFFAEIYGADTEWPAQQPRAFPFDTPEFRAFVYQCVDEAIQRRDAAVERGDETPRTVTEPSEG